MSQPTRGRPRTFDIDEIIDRSVEVFWRQGSVGTTTRGLEQELGISQSSLYNAFGSKEDLVTRALDRYSERLESAVLSHLTGVAPDDDPDEARAKLLRFVDAVRHWVADDAHRGCLLLNLAAEADTGERMNDYRATLRRLIETAVDRLSPSADQRAARTELLLAAVLGLNISARTGASAEELSQLAGGIAHQIEAW